MCWLVSNFPSSVHQHKSFGFNHLSSFFLNCRSTDFKKSAHFLYAYNYSSRLTAESILLSLSLVSFPHTTDSMVQHPKAKSMLAESTNFSSTVLLLLPLNINGPHFLHLDRFLTHPVRLGPSPAIKPHHQAHSFARLLSVKFCYFSARSIIFPTRYLLKHLQLSQHSLLSLLGYALVLTRDYLAEFHPPLLESWSTEQTNRFVSNHNSITWVHLFWDSPPSVVEITAMLGRKIDPLNGI